MPRVLCYSDWLGTLGGGERYLFAVADALRDEAEVVVAGPEVPDPSRVRALGFSAVHSRQRISRSELEAATASYDIFIHLTTRLPPPTRARRSFAIVQFPIDHAGTLRQWRHPRARLRDGDPAEIVPQYSYVVYSEFVRRYLKRRWGVTGTVLTPPMLAGRPPSLEDVLKKKRPQILSVSRFFGRGRGKRQDVLVEAYRQLPRHVQERWPLILCGAVTRDRGASAFIAALQQKARGSNVTFLFDIPADELYTLYSESEVFWHAAGYGRPPWRPDRAEHFGMVTVEAMSRGCVPMVFPDGGQTEIVSPETGFLWRTPKELASLTRLLCADDTAREDCGRRAHAVSASYALDRFTPRARSIFQCEERLPSEESVSP